MVRCVQAGVVGWSLVFTLACQAEGRPTAAADAATAPRADAAAPPQPRQNGLIPQPSPGPLKRPPHPSMATSALGLAAVETLVAATPPPSGPLTTQAALDVLGSVETGCEQRARTLFAQLYRLATDDAGKADAVAGIMLGNLLMPDTQGYQERLTDTYGMSLYVTALKSGTAKLPEAARVLALMAAGRIHDTKEVARRIPLSGTRNSWLRLTEGMARATLGEYGAALDALQAALTADAAPPRAYLERARVWLVLGETASAVKDADAALKQSPGCVACRLVRAQALALSPSQGAQGVAALSALMGEALPQHLLADTLTTAAVAEVRAGHGPAAEALGERLAKMEGYAAEGAAAAGLAAHAQGNHGLAVLALDRAVKALPLGLARTESLWALARSAAHEGHHGRALEALGALESDSGPSAASAQLAAELNTALGQKDAAQQDTLRAHALNPYQPALAKAAGNTPRAGGPALEDQMKQAWRLTGLRVPQQSLALLEDLLRKDPKNPSAAWAQTVAQRLLDEGLTTGTLPGPQAPQFAANAVLWAGKTPLARTFPVAVRGFLLDVLDEGDRKITGKALELLAAQEQDRKLKPLAAEAVARKGPRPPASAHH